VRTEELRQARTKADNMFAKELSDLNAGLRKEKLKPVSAIDYKEWERQTSGTPQEKPDRPFFFER
ncbi:MAG: hypothetical protein ACKOCH_04850, partial [Bacteroidota bacterium]